MLLRPPACGNDQPYIPFRLPRSWASPLSFLYLSHLSTLSCLQLSSTLTASLASQVQHACVPFYARRPLRFVLAGPELVKREKYVITNCTPNFRTKYADFYNSASASVSSILAKISSLWDEVVPPDSIYSEYAMIQ